MGLLFGTVSKNHNGKWGRIVDIQKIRKLLEMMDDSSVGIIEIREGETMIRLEKPAPVPMQVVSAAVQPVAHYAAAGGPAPASNEGEAASVPDDLTTEGKEITAPMVGVFHKALLGGKPVGAGTAIKKGDKVCIIEAMKLMNEILAEADGEILWGEIEEGELVDFGQRLFSYRSV